MSITDITQEEINKCKKDPAYFFQKHVKLITRDGKVVPVSYKEINFKKDILSKILEKKNRK